MNYQIWAVARVALTFFAGMACMFFLVAIVRDGQSAMAIWAEIEDTSLKLLASLGAIVTAAAPIFHAFKSWQRASPESQIERVTEMARDPTLPARAEARTSLVEAAASLPEVQRVIAPGIAESVPSAKVTAR